MPSKESLGVQNLWWSMDYGNVHWVQINTETDYPNSPMGPGTFYNAGPFGEQMVWLLNDLQKAASNRANVPWIIVSGHRPLYSSHHENKNVIAAFEALLLKFNVDIFFAGHVHWSVCLPPTACHCASIVSRPD
jgi:acid phosphatase